MDDDKKAVAINFVLKKHFHFHFYKWFVLYEINVCLRDSDWLFTYKEILRRLLENVILLTNVT